MKKIILSVFSILLPFLLQAQCGNLYINGAIDGPLSGGTPKALQLCASGPIADLSIYGVESVTNGGGSAGVAEFTFPPDALNAGDCIWITTDNIQFNAFFGFTACYQDAFVNINGDDALVLYCNGATVDVFGDPNLDGTGQTWEYLDGWAVSSDAVANPVFNDTEWTYSGANALDGETTNATAANPYPNAVDNCPTVAVCSITNVGASGACSGSDYIFNVNFTASNGSGNYDVIDVTNGNAVIGSGTGSPITITLAGNTSTAPFDVNVVDNADPTCGGIAATVNPLDCSSIPTCPGAYISEFAYDCDLSDANEVIEVAVPNSYTGSLANLQIDLYNGSNSLVYNTITLDNFTVGMNDGTVTYYSWAGSGSSIQNGGPDGLALSFQGAACEFISYEGTILALDGPAVGQTSTDVGVNQSNATTCDETIQLVGGMWVNACATVGDVNSTAACSLDCPMLMLNIGDPCDDMDASTINDVVQADCSCAGTPNPCFPNNVGDPCDDMDATTINDLIQADCSCAGTTVGSCSIGAYISEFAYDCDTGDANEVIEVAVPNSYTGSLADLQVDLYNGSNSLVYNTITLDNFTAGTNDGTVTYYTWAGSGSSIQNGGPDGLALSYQGAACEFLTYEGTITALDGPAVGQMSIDVGVNQTNSTTCDETIQLFGGTWINACATVGDVNSNAACLIDCPTLMLNIGDSCDDMDASTDNDTVQADCTCAGTPNPCFPNNVGDPCDDMNANTINDMIQADCSCAGTIVGACPTGAFISEFHYDNVGTDVGEFIEIAIPNGGDPTQIVVDLYNGNGGGSYGSYNLTSADFVSSDANYDYYVWNVVMQNGPDGIAISCLGGALIEFITYEGAFMATDGPAMGVMGSDIGIEEGTAIQIGESLQFDGTSWGNGCTGSPGTPNNPSTCYDCPISFTNIGDACDDGDPATTGETIQADCSCGGGMGGGCVDTLYVPGPMTAIPGGLYEANHVVTSDGQVIMGDTVTFHGGNYVELRPEFDVPLNTQFSIFINPCGVTPIPKPIKDENAIEVKDAEAVKKD